MGAQRGAHRIPSEILIKIIYTFASFFITLFFIIPCGSPPEAFRELATYNQIALRIGGLPPEAFREGWWVVLDSNQRPLRCQRNALTN